LAPSRPRRAFRPATIFRQRRLGAATPIWQSDPANLRRVIEVNLIGAMLCTRAVLAIMRAQEGRGVVDFRQPALFSALGEQMRRHELITLLDGAAAAALAVTATDCAPPTNGLQSTSQYRP
jgi:NAD(P)-dependent dehydrogenase (short-subunit alcohol dehydrogenase family)